MSLAALGHPAAPRARGQGANCSPVTPGCGVLPSVSAGSLAGWACLCGQGTLVATSAPRPCVRTCHLDAHAGASPPRGRPGLAASERRQAEMPLSQTP